MKLKCFLLLVVVAVCGCGDKFPERVKVSGKVAFQGKPVPTGTIIFAPKDKMRKLRSATGFLLEDGSFEMTSFLPGDGVQPGQYSVVIMSYDEGPLSNSDHWKRSGKKLIPDKYFTHATSGLEADVPTHDIKLDFNLE